MSAAPIFASIDLRYSIGEPKLTPYVLDMPEVSEVELQRLKNAVSELATLNQIASAINVTMSVDQITATIVDHCRRKVKAEQGAIFLLNANENPEDRFKTFVRDMAPSEGCVPFHLSLQLQGWMVKHKTVLLSNTPDADERIRGVNFAAIGLHSLIAAPLLSIKGLIGVLVLFNQQEKKGFSSDDSRFLGIVGTQVAKVIENAKLAEQEKQLAEIQKELKIAQTIQAGFLPKKQLAADGFSVAGFNVPAKDVGGDYYDIIPLDEHRSFLSLGDISGKGLPAALVMSNAQAVIRAQLLGVKDVDIAAVATCLNQVIHQFTSPEQYITAVFGIYDNRDGIFSYVNAGHLPPMVIRDNGTVDLYPEADLVIGVIPFFTYQLRKLTLDPGDTLVLYTDGITEAVSESGDMYGEERFSTLLESLRDLEPEPLCLGTRQAIDSFRGLAEQSDDITVLALSRR